MHQRIVRPHRRRPGPHFVIEVRRRRAIRRIGRIPHVVVAVDLHQPHLAELAFANDAVARFHQVRRAAPLRPDLHHALVFPRRRQHRLAFRHVHADRLLAPDIGARLHGGDRRQRVPVIRRPDQHDDRGPSRRASSGSREYVRGFFFDAWRVRDEIRRVGEHLLIHIAERHHLHRRDLNQPQKVGLAVPSRADQSGAKRLRLRKFQGAKARGPRRWRSEIAVGS